MPTTGTVNTQQILQMGTLTEKLQHTLQQLPTTTGQQLQDEQVATNELKQIEVQEPNNIEASDSTSPEGKRRREVRLRNKSIKDNDFQESIPKSTQDNIPKGDLHQGQHVNFTV